MNGEKEIRNICIEALETREEGEEFIIEGYINKYNTRSKYMGFYEEVAPGAFDNSLEQNNFIPILFNHDSSKILGSTRSGSLKLKSDSIGLRYELRINPKVSYAKDVYELCKNGDINGCSFGFRCIDDKWSKEGDFLIRTIKEAELREVTIATFPAYNDTNVSCRSYENFKNQESIKEKLELPKRKIQLELELS